MSRVRPLKIIADANETHAVHSHTATEVQEKQWREEEERTNRFVDAFWRDRNTIYAHTRHQYEQQGTY